MKMPKFGCFSKLAEWRILKPNKLLLAQDPWRETGPRNSVKVKKTSFGRALPSSDYGC